MKYLTMIRHAKSDRSNPKLGDHDRPLNDRGKSDSPIMGKLLQGLPKPDALLVSTAVRAQQTLELAGYPFDSSYPEAVPTAELYLAEPEDMWDVVYPELTVLDDVWVCAHNPGITELACRLTDLDIENVPTFGIVRVSFEELPTQPVGGTLLYFDCPKNRKR